MKNSYKMVIALFAGAFHLPYANAQTHYGEGVGTVGGGHVFIGTYAGKSNGVNGLYNTYIGYGSGTKSIDGFGNVYLGSFSGEKAENSIANTFIGGSAGQNHVNGEGNVYMGYQAGMFTSGSLNVGIGRWVGQKTKGTQNCFLGNESGLKNEAGSYNVFMGAKTGTSNETGNFNTFLGHGAGLSNTNGEKNTYLGYASGGNAGLINATAVGAAALVTGSHYLVLGNNANVGIGYSAPFYQLQLSKHNAGKAGSSTWAVLSDSRLKRNISEFKEGLDVLKQIKPVWFQYNGKAGIETGDKKFVGIIAQEMQKIAPYTVGTFTHQDSLGNKTDYLDYDANAVTYILINSVKEQQRIIEDKEAKIQALESRLEKLERLMSASPGTFNKQPDGGVLEQNVPNGFSNKTSIKYFIPQSVKTAVIDVYTIAGLKVSSHPISERGAGELVLSADKYRSGVHVYDLIMDGKSFGAKKMVIE
ncbi:tail fiber domain-containing protein [Dyadobacter jiangsuensis]|uniref:Endosialidase-like protein n=1 Tax=Dyadobacter jiangsuensis TaxID=1591085 RepID=A0A2P8G3H5_9BACT|nr:tail fiber domain-containing protein [Dyadobacter jiangsuensis]PSL28519.1 endosialidase-like protein [Dyadobacter jiangsuensis]